MIDLDRLKCINDSMGHESGDLYIKTLANAVAEIINKKQIAYRIGGDEFLILVDGATNEICEDLIEQIERVFIEKASDDFENPSCSCGFSICRSNHKEDLIQAQQKADEMMYQNKKNKNCKI